MGRVIADEYGNSTRSKDWPLQMQNHDRSARAAFDREQS